MRLYEIKHITEPHNPNRVLGYVLNFTHSICPLTGVKREPMRQPDEWDNVNRLTNQLFYAWDDSNPYEGTVYLGEWVKQ